jgi:four helix bundle protein
MKNERSGVADAPAAVVEPEILARTFRFAVEVTRLGVELDLAGGMGRVLAAQLVRAATSVGSMIEEAQAAESRPDFISKMSIGLKEARETHYRLRILAEAGLKPSTRVTALIAEADELRRILAAIIRSARNGRQR